VRLAVDRRSGAELAIKITNKLKLNDTEEVAIRKEVAIMRRLAHPHIVRCLDFQEDAKYFYLVMECVRGGELFDRLVKKKNFYESEARSIVRILVGAIKFMHDRNIVHRDLKPENLLMHATDTDSLSLKIADFGLAVEVAGDEPELRDMVGSPNYVAPEVLSSRPYGKCPSAYFSYAGVYT
jgi:serine/threonine protein kinase